MNIEDEIKKLRVKVKILGIQVTVLAVGVGILGLDALVQSFRIDALM